MQTNSYSSGQTLYLAVNEVCPEEYEYSYIRVFIDVLTKYEKLHHYEQLYACSSSSIIK
jgi:hypothetical protein